MWKISYSLSVYYSIPHNVDGSKLKLLIALDCAELFVCV